MDILIDRLVSKARRADGAPIVRAARLIAPAGQVTVLVGASGAGKSSLLSLAAGLERAASGSVRIGPHCMQPAGRGARTRLRARIVGTATQHGDLIDGLTAAENIELGQRLSRHRDRPFATRVADAAGLGDAVLQRNIGQLSGGEQRRVAVTRAIASGTPCLALDEPTASLDEESAERIRLLLRRSADVGRTVLVVSHDPALAQQADVLAVVAGGTIDRIFPRPADHVVRRLMDAH